MKKYIFRLYSEDESDAVNITVFTEDNETDAQAYEKLKNIIGEKLANKCSLSGILNS